MKIPFLWCLKCETNRNHVMTKSRRGRLGVARKDPDTNHLLEPTALILDPLGKTRECIARCLTCQELRRYGLERLVQSD